MDDIGLIPEDLEIRRSGLHLRKTLDGLIAVGVAIRVRILRHAPDALDIGILGHQLFHNIHIRAVGGHRHTDELKAKLLGDGKVTVIAGHRAEELALLHLRPGARRLRETKHIADVDEVVHQLQAGVAAHEHLAGLHAEYIREQHTGFLQTFQLTIVAGIRAGIGGVIVHLQQVHGQIHLVRAGLAAGHIQLEALGLKFLVLCFSSEFIAVHCKIICHWKHTPLSYFLLPIALALHPREPSCQGTGSVLHPDLNIIVHFRPGNKNIKAKSPAKSKKLLKQGFHSPAVRRSVSSERLGFCSVCAPRRIPDGLLRPPQCLHPPSRG